MGTKSLFVITGGSRGLGEGLVRVVTGRGSRVLQISRRTSPVSGVQSLVCDFRQPQDFYGLLSEAISPESLKVFDVVTLINNAGMVAPIGDLSALDFKQIQMNLTVNLASPMALTSAFLKWTSGAGKQIKVVNISSGVAKRPLAHWAAYSASKAGLENFSLSLKDSSYPPGRLHVVNFQPGVMDTGMQEEIRLSSEGDFPGVQRFREMKQDGRLLSAFAVAEKLVQYITGETLPAYSDISIHDLMKA